MGTFHLKRNDTLPVLERTIQNPDGSVRNITGATGWKLHIRLSDGTKLSRDMSPVVPFTLGKVRYVWQTTDWDTGGLVVGPTLPLAPGVSDHRMEYEIIGPSPQRFTFPNADYDTLRIISDIGQGWPGALWSRATALWKLDEQSGIRVNSLNPGTLDFTPANVPGYVAGRDGNAADFTPASSQALWHADDAALRINPVTGITFSLWIKPDGGISFPSVFTKADWFGVTTEYSLFFTALPGDDLSFDVVGGIGDYSDWSSAVTADLIMGQWHHVLAWYDPVTKTANLDVDGGDKTNQGSPLSGTPFQGTDIFSVASYENQGAYYGGSIDELYVFPWALSAAERAFLWHLGAGKYYPS